MPFAGTSTTTQPGVKLTADGSALVPQFGPSQAPAQTPGPAPLGAQVFGPLQPGQTRSGPANPNSPEAIAKLNEGVFGVEQPAIDNSPEAIAKLNEGVFGTENVPSADTTSGTVSAPGSTATDQDLQDILEVTQAPIPEGGTAVPEAGADLFSDSSLAVQQEENVVDELNRLSTPTIETAKLQQVEDDMFQLVEDRMAELDSRLESDLGSINAQFDQAGNDLDQAQRSETGTMATGLQRIGGFLGPSASSIGAMNNLAKTHRNEVTALEGMKASALQAARNATADQRFELASLRIQEAKALEQEVYNRRQDFFQNILSLNQEKRTEKEFESGQIQDRLEAFGAIAAEGGQLDPQAAREIDEFYGVEGFSAKYASVLTKAKEGEDADNLITRQANLVNLLESIPAGKTISFPDGSEYTGIGASGDVVTSIQKNVQTGEATLISVNKRTGEVTTTGVGNFGVSGTGGGAGGGSSDSDGSGLSVAELTSRAATIARSLQTKDERQAAQSNISVIQQANDIYGQLVAEGGPEVGFALDKVREGLTVDILNNNVSLSPSTRNLGLTSKQSDILNSRMTLMTANFIKSISGAQVSDAERQFLLQASTGEGRSEQANIAALIVMSEAVNRSLNLATGLDTTRMSRVLTDEAAGLAPAAEPAPTTFEFDGGSFNIPFGVTTD